MPQIDKKILFHISGHGFGHACRIIEVIKELSKLAPTIYPIIKTSAPLWLFEMNLKSPYQYFCQVNDIRVVQPDGLHLDKQVTLATWKTFLSHKEKIIKEEVITLPPALLRTEEILYEDLVNAADLVVTKPGYGIVSECIANHTPLLYTSRGDFAEYQVLVTEMGRFIPTLFIPQEDLKTGNWEPYLEQLLHTTTPTETIGMDGATIAAQFMIELTKKWG